MDHLTPVPDSLAADTGERLFHTLLSASRRSGAALLQRLADAPPASPLPDVEVLRAVARGD